MEEVIMFIKDWGALILTLLGSIGVFYAYLKYGRKLKRQTVELNKSLIKQNEQKEVEEKMAKMECKIVLVTRAVASICFSNTGKADASNVRIKILTPKNGIESIIYEPEWGLFDVISPQSHPREEKMRLFVGHPDTIDVEITWNDLYAKNRTVTRHVPIPKL